MISNDDHLMTDEIDEEDDHHEIKRKKLNESDNIKKTSFAVGKSCNQDKASYLHNIQNLKVESMGIFNQNETGNNQEYLLQTKKYQC